MNRTLHFLISAISAICMGLSLSLFTACEGCSGDDEPEYGISITGPQLASTVVPPLLIEGEFVDENDELTELRMQILRDSDGAYWTGTEWGGSGSTELPTIRNLTNWESDGSLVPSGAELADGYYYITAIARYNRTNGAHEERANSVFAVGVVSPPVTPALYGWGANSVGQLGAGVFASSPNLIPVNMRGVLEGKIVVAVSAGEEHNLALTSEGLVYSWGKNNDKQLGNGPAVFASEHFPVAVDTSTALNGKKVVGISAGFNHSLAVDKDGVAYAWGGGLSGALGNNDTSDTDVGQAITVGGQLASKKVKEVVAGIGYSLARTEDGLLYAWGFNGAGQLGIGSTVTTPTPTPVTGLAGKYVFAVSAHGKHVLALARNGLGAVEVYAWGQGTSGQLGNNATANVNAPMLVGGLLTGKLVTAISTGSDHSMALADDKVYVWGKGNLGQLGNGTNGTGNQSNVPIEVGGDLTGKKLVRICAGADFCFAATEDNHVYAWGSNAQDTLPGLGAPGYVLPVEADFSAALTGGRVILGLSAGDDHGIVLTGFSVLPEGQIVVKPVQNGVEAAIANGATINYGTNAVGTSNPLFIRIYNEGNAALTNLQADLPPTEFDFFGTYILPSLAKSDPPAGFYVFFNPQSTGFHTTTLQITSSDPKNSPFTITLEGTAIPAGDVDTGFTNPAITGGSVNAMVTQANGQVVVGGSFTNVGVFARNRIARLSATGSLDPGFDPNVNGDVNCILVQPDGRIVIAGNFSTVGNALTTRNGIARLNPDGSLDTLFNPDATGQIMSMALQNDGKIIIAGSFTDIGGTGHSRLARLETNGTVDTAGFNPDVPGTVRSVAVQTDGKIVIGGSFLSVGGFGHSRIARVEANGDVDNGFTASVSPGSVLSVAVQSDGQVLAGGSFTNPRNRLARWGPSGIVDGSFDPNVSGTVSTIAVQTDGDILIGGTFTTVGGSTTRNNVARIEESGSLDFYFDPNPDNTVNSIGLQADGKILMGGFFANVGGVPRSQQVRLKNTTATQLLNVPDTGTIEWLRGGGSPEVQQVFFEMSGDGGTTWVPLGPGTRSTFPAPAWRLTGAVMPATGHVRAYAFGPSGQNCGSSSLLETIAAYGGPSEIEVTSTGNILHDHLGSRDFGVAATGTGFVDVVFTIQNTGTSTLKELGGTSISGANAVSFKIIAPPAPTVAGNGGTTTFTVRFNPRIEKFNTALLTIPNNDPNEGMFKITLTGDGGISVPNWKIQKGIAGAPDTGDTDGDDISELLENAIGTSPTEKNGDSTSISLDGGGGSFAPPPTPPSPSTISATNWRWAISSSKWNGATPWPPTTGIPTM